MEFVNSHNIINESILKLTKFSFSTITPSFNHSSSYLWKAEMKRFASADTSVLKLHYEKKVQDLELEKRGLQVNFNFFLWYFDLSCFNSSIFSPNTGIYFRKRLKNLGTILQIFRPTLTIAHKSWRKSIFKSLMS